MKVKEDYLLVFSPDAEWTGYLVSNGDGGFNWFDTDGEWEGYLISNSNGGWNLFTIEAGWTAFTT